MKIIQIVGSINPRIGGKERFAGELTKELLSYGHEVSLVTCDRNYEADIDCDVRYISTIEIPGFPPIPSFKDLTRQLDMEFDICHLHYHAIFGEIAAFVCKKHGIPLITTIHDEMKRGIHKKIYDRILLGTISRLSDRIVCLTIGMKKALIKRGLDAKKISIIPNVIYVRELQHEAYKLKNDSQLGDEIDLLFVGRLEERKGVQYLLRALSILKAKGIRPILKVVGEGAYKRKLESVVMKEGLSSQVFFTGYVTREELLKSYLATRCVVIPSLYEGIPSVAIEALALGKPVIVTSIPGMEAITSKKLGFTVPPRDFEALAEAISKMLSIDNDELHRIESEGKSFAEEYDWSFIIEQIFCLYQDCIENKT